MLPPPRPGAAFDWKHIPWILCKPGNIDGEGGRGMSLREVLKLTLPQALYLMSPGPNAKASQDEISQMLAVRGREIAAAGDEAIKRRKEYLLKMSEMKDE